MFLHNDAADMWIHEGFTAYSVKNLYLDYLVPMQPVNMLLEPEELFKMTNQL
jgi:hypothetical protein